MKLLIALLGLSLFHLAKSQILNSLIAIGYNQSTKQIVYYKGNGEDFYTTCFRTSLPILENELLQEFRDLAPLNYLNCSWTVLPKLWPIDTDLYYDSYSENWYLTMGGNIYMHNLKANLTKLFWMGTSTLKLRVDLWNGGFAFSCQLSEQVYQLRVAPMDKTSMRTVLNMAVPFTFDIIPVKQKIIYSDHYSLYETYYDGKSGRVLGKVPDKLTDLQAFDDYLLFQTPYGMYLQEFGKPALIELSIPKHLMSLEWSFNLMTKYVEPPKSNCVTQLGVCDQLCFSYYYGRGKPHCLCDESSLVDVNGKCHPIPGLAKVLLVARNDAGYSVFRLSGEVLVQSIASHHKDELFIDGHMCTFVAFENQVKATCRSFMYPEGWADVKVVKYIRDPQKLTFSNDQMNFVVFLYDGVGRLLLCSVNVMYCKAVINAQITILRADGISNLVFYVSPSFAGAALYKAAHWEWASISLFRAHYIFDFSLDKENKQIAVLYKFKNGKRISVISYDGVGVRDFEIPSEDTIYATSIAVFNGTVVTPHKDGVKLLSSDGRSTPILLRLEGFNNFALAESQISVFFQNPCLINNGGCPEICLGGQCLLADPN